MGVTYLRGFFFGPGLPRALESPFVWPIALFAVVAEPLPLLPFGVDASAPGAGVELDSDNWSTEGSCFKVVVSPLIVGGGDGCADEGVVTSAGSGMPSIAASLSFGTRSVMTFVFFAIIME